MDPALDPLREVGYEDEAAVQPESLRLIRRLPLALRDPEALLPGRLIECPVQLRIQRYPLGVAGHEIPLGVLPRIGKALLG